MFKFGAALRESDAYLEQFHTEKLKFTASVSFTVILGNMKEEDLKGVWRDFALKNANFLNW